MVSNFNKFAGKARMVRMDDRPKCPTLYGFRFLEKKGEWILQ
jgi:hypothetical protein